MKMKNRWHRYDTWADLGVDMDANIVNICLTMMMFIFTKATPKQHLKLNSAQS